MQPRTYPTDNSTEETTSQEANVTIANSIYAKNDNDLEMFSVSTVFSHFRISTAAILF